mmetsp:Transcript_24657/g.66440  ORF Transcript_24657/g.66440 Transcript_24657/m.66440 type:complete len:239 (+) Transcript_24657:466-1182(+)
MFIQQFYYAFGVHAQRVHYGLCTRDKHVNVRGAVCGVVVLSGCLVGRAVCEGDGVVGRAVLWRNGWHIILGPAGRLSGPVSHPLYFECVHSHIRLPFGERHELRLPLLDALLRRLFRGRLRCRHRHARRDIALQGSRLYLEFHQHCLGRRVCVHLSWCQVDPYHVGECVRLALPGAIRCHADGCLDLHPAVAGRKPPLFVDQRQAGRSDEVLADDGEAQRRADALRQPYCAPWGRARH